MTSLQMKITALAVSLAVVIPLAFVSITAGADPWPETVTVGAGHERAALDIPLWTDMGKVVANPDNFGSEGVVPTDATLKPEARFPRDEEGEPVVPAEPAITAEYLSDVDVYFDGWMRDTDWVDGEIDDIVTWVEAGGVLIITDDDSDSNDLSAEFGAGTPLSRFVGAAGDGTAIVPDTSNAAGLEIASGPFGTWTSADALGTFGYFTSLPAGWTQLAVEQGTTNPVMMTRAAGAGHVILVTDEGLFRNEDLTGACNVMAYAISLVGGTINGTPGAGGECEVAAPPPGPTPTPGGPTPTPPSPTPTPGPTPEPGAVMCNGQEADIVGTAGDDVIDGTAGPDVIHALAGNDTVDGGGGDDIICGGLGSDMLKGGPGRDMIFGNKGGDNVRGGLGADVLKAGAGDDIVVGKKGNDDLFGGLGNDDLRGGFGKDDIEGGGGADTANGGPGNDTVAGNKGKDTVDGGAGSDVCSGGPGVDSATRCEVWSPF
ncbi:MAG: hypothetical protein ACR2PK_19910 [Acidimicrobiales bacterium]